MSDHSPVPDGRLAELLVACDEALAAGAEPPAGPADHPLDLPRAVAVLRLLRGALAPDPPRPPDRGALPAQIGRFRVLREIGRGAFGTVYLAHDPKLGREVALKVPSSNSLFSPERLQRFVREARAAARLNHSHIVAVYESDVADGACYIASEYCPGPSLDAWLDGRRRAQQSVPCADAARLIEVLARAVQHAHQRGVVHRDLKPANVLLKLPSLGAAGPPGSLADYIPMVADFGLAHLSDVDGSALASDKTLTETGAIVGTAKYMAPEQAAGRNDRVGPPADVYALGVVLYELLTGGVPFPGPTRLDVLRRVTEEEPIPPRRVRAETPRDLETVCLKCLEKEPAKRYPSAGGLADDLRRFLDGEPILARPATRAERAWKAIKRRRAWAALGAVSVLAVCSLLGGGTGWAFWHEARGRADAEGGRADAEAEAKRLAEELKRGADAARAQAEGDALKNRLLADIIVGGIPFDDPIGLNGDSFPVPRAIGASLPILDVLRRSEARCESGLRDQPEEVRAAVLDTLGNAYRTLGMYPEAERHLRRALELRGATRGRDDLEFADSLFGLAWLHRESGAFAEAEPLYRRALDIRRQRLEPDHPAVTAALYHLAWLYAQDEDFPRAKTLFDEVIERRGRWYGAGHREVLVAKMGLAALPAEQGNLSAGRELLVQTIQAIVKQSGDANVQRVILLFGAGTEAYERGLLQLAGLSLQGALVAAREAFGDRHAYVALVQFHLAEVLEKAGKLQQAEENYYAGLAIARERVGLEHEKMSLVVANMARLLGRRGKRAEAERLFEELIAARRRRFAGRGPRAEAVAASGVGLAAAQGVGLLGPLAALYAGPPDHFAVANAMLAYADVLQEWGDFARQESVCRAALAIYERAGGARRRLFTTCLNDLAMARLRQGDSRTAEELLRKALACDRARSDNPDERSARVLYTARTLTNLAAVLAAQEKEDEARLLVNVASRLYAAVPGAEKGTGKKPGGAADAQSLQKRLGDKRVPPGQ